MARRTTRRIAVAGDELRRVLYDHSSDAIMVVDRTLAFLDVNRSACTLLGLTPAEARGLSLRDFLLDGDPLKALPTTTHGTALATGTLRRRDGGHVTVELDVRPLRGTRRLLILRDITTAQQREEALRFSEQKFAKAFHTSPDSISIQRLDDGLYVDINEGFTRLTGYEPSEVLGKTSTQIGIWAHPPERAAIVESIRAHGEATDMEATFRMKDGLFRVGLVSAKIIHILGETCVLSITRDITDRKRDEEHLRANEERLRLALIAANEGLYDLNVETGEAQFTPEYATMLGYDPATFELTLDRWAASLHPDDHERVLSLYNRYVGGAVPEFDTEFRLRTATGEWRWIRSVGRIVSRNRAGKPLRMLGIQSDITAQRNAEHALQLARFAIEHTTDAVYWTDDHTRILEVNDAACRALGYSREELTTLTLADIDPDFSADNRPIHWDHVPPGGTYTLERRHRTKDGRAFPVEVLTSLITTGGRRFGCSFARDISARKQVEEELHHREHLLLESQRVARLGSYDFDIGRGTWICSRMLEELFGIPPDYPKDVPHWLAIIHPDHRTVMEHYLLDHVVRGRHPFDREYRVVRPQDGVELWVHGLGELECDEAGVPLHMIGTIQDITNEHRINEEIRRLNEELELRVRERTAQLEAANRELESFSYSVSHDLRAPLRAVDGFSKALLEDYGEAFDGEGRDYLHRVRAGAQRMGCLIDDLLRLSRISRADLRRIPVDLSALATSILDDLRQNDPGRTVEVVIAPGAVASVDPGLIQIVFENLLRNAWTFTSKHPTARIEFGCATRSDSAAWFIRDDGAGFDMAYAEKLFGVFQRLHRAEEFPGTGIGLATVQRIIHRHGGRIWAEGAVEHGATFTFTLPPPIH